MLEAIARAAGAEALEVLGAFHPGPRDRAPEGCGTLILLGPSGAEFWSHATAAAEFGDGGSDPLDRWSERVIGDLAGRFGAVALFPFGGPPYQPFYTWALASGRAWASPVTLLVHDRAGLMVSYRGALALPQRLDLPPAPPCPCDTCVGQPCRTACPVGALRGDGYDLGACHGFLDEPAGADCMNHGCAARRACPVSKAYGRDPSQSAHHMRYFHP